MNIDFEKKETHLKEKFKIPPKDDSNDSIVDTTFSEEENEDEITSVHIKKRKPDTSIIDQRKIKRFKFSKKSK